MKNLIKHILNMDKEDFEKSFVYNNEKLLQKKLFVSGLLGLSNKCKNNCSYCGLRRDRKISRYSLEIEKVASICEQISKQKISRIFFISGERAGFSFDNYLKIINIAKGYGLETNLAAGMFDYSQYKELKSAGLDIYTLKFESCNEAIFSLAKPDVSFKDRLESIESIKKAGLFLGSGNIIGLAKQNLSDLANDIELMVKLKVDWAPVVPYLPAPETPMAKTTPMGSVDLTLRTITLLRMLLPKVRITAGQPSQDSKQGFADTNGTIEAIKHGADSLFVELTPLAMAEKFDITEGRKLPRIKEIETMIKPLGAVWR